MNPPIDDAFQSLFERYGEQHWWPAETRFEMMLGAILTQNTAWTNVEIALSNLRNADALNFQSLETATRDEIAEWIRPAGYFNQKSGYIKAMIETLRNRFNSSLDELFALETSNLRNELLSWKGIGPETADSIILYAAERPVFVVDAYTKRICSRHGWMDEKATYNEIANLFTDRLPTDVQLFSEYHAMIVRVCKDHCNTKPKCEGCPLEQFL
jgi:endonuclease-3 related protein